MGDSERRVAMVRIEREEELYSVEEMLGRDVKSVFPTKAAPAEAQPGTLDTEAIREMLGGKKFVSAKELEEIRSQRGQQDGEGPTEPLKPLVEVLREAKEKKEQAFADMWKQMKTGKNRPLDEDEMAFLEEVAASEAARLREQAQRERDELEEFRRAAAALAEEPQAQAGLIGPEPRPASATAQQAPHPRKPAGQLKPLIRAVVKTKAKAPGGGQQKAQKAEQGSSVDGTDRGREEPPAKRLKADAPEQLASQEGGDDGGAGLPGLLGYDNSDDDDSSQ